MPNNAVLQVLIKARDRTQGAFTRVRRAVNRLNRNMKRFGRRMTSVFGEARTQVLALAAVIGGLGKIVTGPSEFELQMARVGTLGQEAREAVKGMSEEVKRLSVEHGKSPIEIADALFDTISAGASATEAIGILNESLRLSVAGVADLKSTVGGLSTVANAFQITTAEGMKDLAEQMNAAQIAAKSTIQLISSNIGKLASTFKEAGISTEEMFVSLADVTRNADSTEEAATSLRAALTSILKPAADLKEVMTRLGIPMGKMAFEGRTLGEVFSQIANEADRLGIPIQTLIPNVRAMSAVSTLAARNGDRFKEAMEGQKRLLGELDKSYEDIQGTLTQALKKFKSLIDVLTIEFSGEFLAGFREALNAITDKDLPRMQLQARIMGAEYRLVLAPIIDAISAVSNGFFFMINTIFRFTQMVMLSIDSMKERILASFESYRTAPLFNLLFDSDLDQFNDRLIKITDERKELQRELIKINEGIAAGGIEAKFGTIRGSVFKVRSAQSLDELERRKNEIEASLNTLLAKQAALVPQMQHLQSAGATMKTDGTLEMTLEEEHQVTARIAQSRATVQRNTEQLESLAAEMGESNNEFLLKASAAMSSLFDPTSGDETRDKILALQQALKDLGETGGPNKAVADIGKIGPAIDDLKTPLNKLEEGFLVGIGNILEAWNLETLETQLTDLGETVTRSMANSLSSFFDDIATGTASAKEAFQDFGRTILRVMNDIIAQQIVLNLLSAIPGNPFSIKGAANGAVWEGGFQAFANGGVINKPTLGLVGEGRFNEAVVPLPDGRRIPVDLRGNNQQSEAIIVNISAVDGASVERLLATSSGKRAIQSAMRDARATRRDLR